MMQQGKNLGPHSSLALWRNTSNSDIFAIHVTLLLLKRIVWDSSTTHHLCPLGEIFAATQIPHLSLSQFLSGRSLQLATPVLQRVGEWIETASWVITLTCYNWTKNQHWSTDIEMSAFLRVGLNLPGPGVGVLSAQRPNVSFPGRKLARILTSQPNGEAPKFEKAVTRQKVLGALRRRHLIFRGCMRLYECMYHSYREYIYIYMIYIYILYV